MKGLLFTYALTYGGTALALFRPYYGFLAYVCFGIIRPTSLWFYSVPPGNYSRIIAGGLLVGWFFNGMGNWQFGRARPIVQWLLAFWAICLLSTLQATHFDSAWNYFEILSKILLPLIIGVSLIDSVDKLKQLIWVIVLSQGMIAYEMNMLYFSGYNRFYFDGFASLDNNGVALTMVTAAGIAFFLMLHETSHLRRCVAAFVSLFLAHAVMLSFSRGGMLALIMCGLVGFWMLPKRPVYVAAFTVAFLIGLRLAGPQVIERFVTVFASQEERDASAESRLGLWKACIQEMVENPLLGIGPDHFNKVVHEYGFERGKAAHTTWLQVGAEMGVLGLLAIACFFGLTIWRLWLLACTKEPGATPEMVAIARMVICALVGYFVAAQFVSVSLVEIPYYVAAVGIGVLKLTSQPEYQTAMEGNEEDEFALEDRQYAQSYA